MFPETRDFSHGVVHNTDMPTLLSVFLFRFSCVIMSLQQLTRRKENETKGFKYINRSKND